MKTIRLDDGKYEFDLDDQGIIIAARRNGEYWDAGMEWQYSKAIICMVWRIAELEEAAKQINGAQRTHTTQSGESLGGIALHKCGDEEAWHEIIALNPDFGDWTPSDYFPVGTVLILPLALKQPATELDRIARKLHYPEHWDVAAYPTLESAIMEAISSCSECQGAPVAVRDRNAVIKECIDPLKALACMVLDAESGKTDQINSYAGVLRFVYDAVAASQAAPDTNFLDDIRRKVAAAPRRQFESAPGAYTNWLDQGAVLDILDAARGESA